jgi:hypothetical protein
MGSFAARAPLDYRTGPGGLLDGGPIPLLAAVALAGGVPVIYSYFLYRRLAGGSVPSK